MNVSKSKVIMFEKGRDEVISFAKQNQVRTEGINVCKIWLGEEKMKKVNKFRYAETDLCKHETMEGGSSEGQACD